MQFGNIFTYSGHSSDMSRVKYSDCRLLRNIGDYMEGTAVDQIWFDLLTGDLWLVPDSKCHWDITDNFPVSL